MLADRGWRVRHLGIDAHGDVRAIRLPKHPSISVTLMSAPAGGWRTAAHYARFLIWCREQISRLGPDVVYCSDEKSYLVGLWATQQKGIKTVLHEHDPPPRTGGRRASQLLQGARKHFARRASLIVIPQQERARRFIADTGAAPARLNVIYNCPSRRELGALPLATRVAQPGLTLWYHGTLGSGQLPTTILDALARLPPDVRFEMAGYETISCKGRVGELLARARELGITGRVQVHGVLPLRADLLSAASRADVGLALFANQFRDPMVGASNKPFDYLASGLPLLTNRTPEWESFFGVEGVSVSCDPEDPDDIARAVLELRNDPNRRRAMARVGRRLIETKWNYETQFAKVIDFLETVSLRKSDMLLGQSSGEQHSPDTVSTDLLGR
jgi:glycosyltransferase involved in cell wall biosynthesis